MTRTYADGIEDAATMREAAAIVADLASRQCKDDDCPHYMALEIARAVRSIPVAASRSDALWDAIKHGDGEHRAWLKEALQSFFAGLPVPAPRGGGTLSTSPSGIEDVREALTGWQPIETAPKDGTEILVLIRPKVIRLGWYFAPSSRTYGWRDESSRRITPTHWMPLPSPPSEESPR